jgi:U6 snRNA-associated Sm-like protein LSm6
VLITEVRLVLAGHCALVGLFQWFTGVLWCLDGYMNIALEQTEENVNGVVTNRYGDAFIRGNNGHCLPLASDGPRLVAELSNYPLFSVLYISAAEAL